MKSVTAQAAFLAAGVLAAAAVAADSGPSRMDPDPDCLKPGDVRTMAITYTGDVKEIPAGTKRLRVWLPVPRTTPVQAIADLKFEGSPPKLTTEARHGNTLAYFEVENPGATFDATFSFTCTRKEQVTDLAKLAEDGRESDASAADFLKDERLTVVDDSLRAMAAEATKGKATTLAKARGIYDAVMAKMTYDKTGTGWGRGDVQHACETCKGNCTDFHALFMGMCRASGIPAGFEIGLFPPYKRGSDEKLGGYHCWAFFRVPGKAWVPVDISEADKVAGTDPKMVEYFFGAHTSNRVTLSVGRDLVLEPKQDGDPVNYLLNPYAEADGKPVAGVSKDWTCKDR